jgi:hypothetical protein
MLTLATDADLPEAVALINASYRCESSRQGWTHEADYSDGERTSLEALKADLEGAPGAKLHLLRDAPGGVVSGPVDRAA